MTPVGPACVPATDVVRFFGFLALAGALMPTVTITGASGAGVVNFLTVTSASTAAIAQAAADNISSLFGAVGQQNVNAGYAGGSQIVGSLGSASQSSVGTLSPILNSNVVALTINNSATTNVANSRFMGSQTVLAGSGNLNFTDNAGSTYIITGGGTNNITFSSFSSNGTFNGDGGNTINVNATAGTTSVFGTSSSSDTIQGSATGSNIVYTSATGATAFINPSASNITVFGAGGVGSTTVFGGANTPGTGKLNVVAGRGLFQGGTSGSNIMSSSSVGGTTLIGGGNNDVLSSRGVGDVVNAGGIGVSTLDASYSKGSVTLQGSRSGASLIYASQTQGDTIFTTSSIYDTGSFVGEFVQLHTGPNSLFRSLNNSVSSTIVGGGGQTTNAVQKATMGDFISGLDKLVLVSSVVGAYYGIATGSYGPGAGQVYTNVQTANGSLFTFYNSTLTTNDIKIV